MSLAGRWKVTPATTTSSPLGAIALRFACVLNGDEITGTCKTSFGEDPFTAVRI